MIVDEVTSEKVLVVSGVPQDTVLGLLLFLIFINNRPKSVSSSTRIFNKDCVVYRKIHSDQDGEQVQEDIVQLTAWESKWGMTFHPDTCSVMRISRSRSPIQFKYRLKTEELEVLKLTTPNIWIFTSHPPYPGISTLTGQ